MSSRSHLASTGGTSPTGTAEHPQSSRGDHWCHHHLTRPTTGLSPTALPTRFHHGSLRFPRTVYLDDPHREYPAGSNNLGTQSTSTTEGYTDDGLPVDSPRGDRWSPCHTNPTGSRRHPTIDVFHTGWPDTAVRSDRYLRNLRNHPESSSTLTNGDAGQFCPAATPDRRRHRRADSQHLSPR